MQESTDRQFNHLINQINEQNIKWEYFTKEIETIKKNQIEILEMKTSVKEIKNELMSPGQQH